MANQEISIFERYAEENYGVMRFWADGETAKIALHSLEAKEKVLSNNGWSIIGKVEQKQSVGIITLSRTAFRLP